MSKNNWIVCLILLTFYLCLCVFSCFIEEKEVKINSESKSETIIEVDASKETVETIKPPVIVYNGLTYEGLVEQLEKSLNYKLEGTAKLYADLCLQYGVDPYVAVAISLLETGCKWNCTVSHNNVGGNMVCYNGKCYIRSFNTIEEGITYHISNLYNGFYAKGITEVTQIGRSYAASPTWSQRVYGYIEEIRNK